MFDITVDRMERDRGFNFKLLVPPRVNAGQVSAVRPQEAVGKCADIMDTLQHFGNESLSIKLEERISENEDLRNKNNATRNLCNILKDTLQRSAEKRHLFESEREDTHQLFMENSESVQKLIGAFESLRIRVEADQQEMLKVKEGFLQFDELKDKYCHEYNLKEEELAGLQTKLQNKEDNLQKILLDLHETQKNCNKLQEATDQQHELLKTSITERESLLQKLHTAEQQCTETQKNHEAIAAALEHSKDEFAQIIQSKDSSLQELGRVKIQQAEKLEQIQTTIKELQNSLALEIQRARELKDQLVENKHELERKSALLCETTEQSAKKDGQIEILENELAIKSKSIESMKRKFDLTDVKVDQLSAELSRKTEEAQLFKNEAEVAFAENDLLKTAFEAAEKAQEDLKRKSTQIKVQELEGRLFTEMKKNEEQMEQLRKDIAMHNSLHFSTFQNKILKNQVAKEIEKTGQLENVINSLQEESQILKRLNEDNQKLLKDLDYKSTFAAELENELQKLRLTAAEAVKNKEDAELKCQHKIADMVTLMEKHKSQYDRMVEEKDAELEENKKKETEAVAQRKFLELALSKHKTETDQLKKQLKTETTKKENLQRELKDLKIEMSSMKITPLSVKRNKQSPAPNRKQGRCSETPKETASKRHVFNFSKTWKTPPCSRDERSAAVVKNTESDTESIRASYGTTPKTKDVRREDLKSPRSMTFKSYRIRTPPSGEKAACWKKSTIELDSKSDSSDQTDLLSFANGSVPSTSAPHCKLNPYKKSLATHKSPGNYLKLAAMKRMRDAGWTAMTGCDKKKKKTNEKIFA
ncbi:hypothetical protein F2P81_012355 [Scophthalmus maximus]|uniref:Synaptonemal complex protein 1 n=1 Tax=Scophthalmus maximus TaxID=52904 RepID=A0A6A4SN31_SCOMX|nr:hypothetical protein F2P81_012355 [Scophthalmus maximus]